MDHSNLENDPPVYKVTDEPVAVLDLSRIGADQLLSVVSEAPIMSTELAPENLFAPELDVNPIIDIRWIEGTEGIFNATILEIEGRMYLAGRSVLQAAPAGQPDVGPLVLARLATDRHAVLSVKEIWRPTDAQYLLEDLRAFRSKNGFTILGATAVDRLTNRPHLAKIVIDSTERLLSEPLPPPKVYKTYRGEYGLFSPGGILEGKNTTALDERHDMFRPEGATHSLQVLKYTENEAIHAGYINFPKNIPWAEYKLGTTTPPEWLNDSEAYLEFHGISKVNGLFDYSIGTARLVRGLDKQGRVVFSVDNISRKAIITPDSFPPLPDNRPVELHPQIRRAVYNCGAISIRNQAGELIVREIFPNQGDMRTYHVVINVAAIIAGWDRRLPVGHVPAVAINDFSVFNYDFGGREKTPARRF